MNENNTWYPYFAVLVIGLALCLVYIFDQSVSDNRNGADAVRTKLNVTGKLIDSSIDLAEVADSRIVSAEERLRKSFERLKRTQSGKYRSYK